jgi:GT2 family glycosyltransferase
MDGGECGLKTTSIIIPNFNGLSYLKDCIYSIREHTHLPYELIVVDNGSTDGSVDFCLSERVTIVSLGYNAGFPAACNLGLKVASGDALLLLNNDVIVTENWLFNMQRCLYSQEEIGIVGPMTNFASGAQQIDEPFTNIGDMAARFNRPDRKKWKSTNRIVGMCMLFKRELLERIGYLDERFSPGHFEDDDFCYRARQAGFRLMICGDVFVFHHGSASFGRQGEERVQRLIRENRQKFLEKWGLDPLQFVQSKEAAS